MTPPAAGGSCGRVVLVGAGPGDPDLLTLRAAAELRRAEVLLYDALIPPAIVALAAPDCERIDVGKRGDGSCGVSQDHIAELLCAQARAGRYVVRLKGGDPFVFGRGGEEASALAAAGIPFEVVPGVSAAVAAAAYAGIPVTDRRFASSFTVVTGHLGGRAIEARGGWEGLARAEGTLVVLMGTRWLGEIAARLIAGGRAPTTPAAVIQSGTTAQQRVVVGELADIAGRVREAGLRSPTTIVIGDVVRLRETIDWFRPRPLAGRRVLLLRPRAQQQETLEQLAEAGAQPLCVPLLELAPPEDPGPLRRALARLPEYDWLLLTSANAVEFAAEPWAAAVAAACAAGRPRVACMGGATAARARRLGLAVELVAEPPGPEALLAALERSGPLAGARVLLPRSEAASEWIPERLRALGAKLDCAIAYRNRLPEGAAQQLAAALEPPPDAVLLTSASAAQRLRALLGGAALARLAQRSLLVCIGESTRAALAEVLPEGREAAAAGRGTQAADECGGGEAGGRRAGGTCAAAAAGRAGPGELRVITAERASGAGLVEALTRYYEAHGFS